MTLSFVHLLHLQTQLRPPLVVHIGSVVLVETAHRQHTTRMCSSCSGQLLKHQHSFGCSQCGLHGGMLSAAEQIIFQHDCMLGLAIPQALQSHRQRVIRRTKHGRTQAIYLRQHRTQPHRAVTLSSMFSGFAPDRSGHIGCSP